MTSLPTPYNYKDYPPVSICWSSPVYHRRRLSASCISSRASDSCNRHNPTTTVAMWSSTPRQDNPSRTLPSGYPSARTGTLQKSPVCSPATVKEKWSIPMSKSRQDSLPTPPTIATALSRTAMVPTAITSASTTTNIPTCLPIAPSIVPDRPSMPPPSCGKSYQPSTMPPSVIRS